MNSNRVLPPHPPAAETAQPRPQQARECGNVDRPPGQRPSAPNSHASAPVPQVDRRGAPIRGRPSRRGRHSCSRSSVAFAARRGCRMLLRVERRGGLGVWILAPGQHPQDPLSTLKAGEVSHTEPIPGVAKKTNDAPPDRRLIPQMRVERPSPACARTISARRPMCWIPSRVMKSTKKT